MDPLPPIPTPPAQRWREFRIQVLPLIVFVMIVATVVFLWRQFVQPVGVVGEAEAIRANVTTLHEGLLSELTVELFQPVTKGQVLGQVAVQDKSTIQAMVDALEADLRIMSSRMTIDERRREQDYAALRFDWMKEQVSLAADRALLIQASNEFVRVTRLFTEKIPIVPASEYDIAKANFEARQVQVETRQKLIDGLGRTLADMEKSGAINVDSPVEKAVTSKLAELNATLGPSPLRAPVDGVVSVIYRRSGEKVVRGEPIVTISAAKSERIVGYIRQPVTMLPAVNDKVVIRTRKQPRKIAEATILQVGAQMEPIRPGLISPDTTRIESGLPILVNLPEQLEVLPGELVDLTISYAKR